MAANKNTLADCITYAMEKELSEKNTNVKEEPKSKQCTFHKKANHTEDECRRNQASTSSSPSEQNTSTQSTNQSSRSYRALQTITNQRFRPQYGSPTTYGNYRNRPSYSIGQQLPISQFQRMSMNNQYQSQRPGTSNQRENQNQNYNRNDPRPYSQNFNRSDQRPYTPNRNEPRPYHNQPRTTLSNYNNNSITKTDNSQSENRTNNNSKDNTQSRQLRAVRKEPSIEDLQKKLEREEEKN